jgi:hypothetical protein
MQDELVRLLRDTTLLTLAFAIALGWSLFQFASGVATFLDALVTRLPPDSINSRFYPVSGDGFGLTWVVGRHVVSLDGVFTGLVEVGVVLLVAAIVRRRIAPPR